MEKILNKEIKMSVKLIKTDTNDNEKAIAQLPKSTINVLKITDLGFRDGLYYKRIIFRRYSDIKYEELVNKLIAERYTIQDELAIHRKYKKGVNEAEFNEYDTFVEECKLKAKEFIAEREKVLGGK